MMVSCVLFMVLTNSVLLLLMNVWIDLCWLLGAEQVTLSLPFLSKMGEKNVIKSSMDSKTRSCTSYSQEQMRLDLGKLI